MIAYVSGTLVSIKDDSVVVDNQGMGYRIFCPYSYRFTVGEACILYTYYYVREDAIMLYGFETSEELDVFMKLITVKGLGPKTGMQMLGKVPYREVVSAIETSNLTYLKTLPGVGPKMASQMVLDLKGKLVHDYEAKQQNSPVFEEVFLALMDLGFKRSEVNNIKRELIESQETEIDKLIRVGLKLLAR